VIVPYLRGYGTTRFLSNETFRNGQPSLVAVDIINLTDALKIDKDIIAGFERNPANCRCRHTLSSNGGTNFTLPRNAGAQAMTNTGTILRS
jgi:hypothetical protein